MTKEEREAAFLQEYSDICKKYRVTIDSCGCCDSPWLVDHDDSEGAKYWDDVDTNVNHLKETL